MTPSDSTPPEEQLDRDAILARVANDQNLLAAMIAIYHRDTPQMLEEVRQAVQARDAGRLRRAAHALKSGIVNFSEGPIYQAAFRLEMMGKQDDLSDVEAALADLESAFPRLTEALDRLTQELS